MTAEPVVGVAAARPVEPPVVAEIVARHRLVSDTGKCVWCGCNWPCDARVLADELGVDADPTSVPIFAPADPAAVDVARLETLEAQATSGPWCADGDEVLSGDDGTRLAAYNASPEDVIWPDDIHEIASCGGDDEHAEFIAAMRNAAPSLLAAYRAVERVRAIHVSGLYRADLCACCGKPWPCPTIRALDGAE
jgi:hypothetical protein